MYYDYIDKIYNLKIPLKEIASVGKIKKDLSEYIKDWPQDLRSGQAAEWYSLRLREITQSLLTRKKRELLLSPLLQAE